GEAAADVQVPHGAAHLGELHVDVGGLLQGVLDGDDARDLAADVEVQQLQGVEHVRGGQAIDEVDDLRGREPELGAIARGLRPATDAAGGELGADAEH